MQDQVLLSQLAFVYIAHMRTNCGEQVVQTVRQHLGGWQVLRRYHSCRASRRADLEETRLEMHDLV